VYKDAAIATFAASLYTSGAQYLRRGVSGAYLWQFPITYHARLPGQAAAVRRAPRAR
jgi:hypothetical protein